jgi:hypothetical protein
MNDLANIDRDAFWPVMGRAMAAALARAPGLVTRAVPGAWRVTSDVDTWMANWSRLATTSWLFRTFGDEGQRREVARSDDRNPLWFEHGFHRKCGRADILDTCVQLGMAVITSS